MSARRKNSRKKKNNTGRLVLVFFSTLTAVVAVGVCALFVFKDNLHNATSDSIKELGEVETADNINPDKVMFSETIPEEDGEKSLSDNAEEANADETEESGEAIEETAGKYDAVISDEEYLRDNNIYVIDGYDSELVTLSFAGDILFDPGYAVMARLNENGGEISAGISPNLIEEMKAADIMMLNNEFPYSYGGEPIPEKAYTFRAKPDSVRYLDDIGVDVVSIANNHAFDYGESAFLDTVATLEGAGMPYVGGGRNIAEASRPVYFIVNDVKIGILSATQIERLDNPDTRGATDSSPGVFRCLDNSRLLNVIAETKENCDFLVVYIHWGTESTTDIDWLQEKQGPEMVDAGVDLIIGDHPHVLQPITTIKGVPVIYSLGNFWFNSYELDTGMLQAVINGEGIQKLRFVPCKQSGCKTRMLEGVEARALYDYMMSISPGISIDSDGYITF